MRNINKSNTKGDTNVKSMDLSRNTKSFKSNYSAEDWEEFDLSNAEASYAKDDWDKFQYTGDSKADEMNHVSHTNASEKEVNKAIERGRYMRIGRMMILASEAKMAA